jgi:GAF domain-containing protein
LQEFPYGDNTTSAIIDVGVPLLYGTGDEYSEFERSHGLTSYLVGERDSESGIFVPRNTGSRTIGAMSVQSERSHAYTLDDAQLLAVIASQAAVAIENARLYKRSQDSVRQMQALLSVAQTINQTLELGSVFDAILLSIREVLPTVARSDRDRRDNQSGAQSADRLSFLPAVRDGHGDIHTHAHELWRCRHSPDPDRDRPRVCRLDCPYRQVRHYPQYAP